MDSNIQPKGWQHTEGHSEKSQVYRFRIHGIYKGEQGRKENRKEVSSINQNKEVKDYEENSISILGVHHHWCGVVMQFEVCKGG